MHALGIPEPRVAVSAVETVTESIRSTSMQPPFARWLCTWVRSLAASWTPLAFDNAVSTEAAKTKGIVSPWSLAVPTFVVLTSAGNMLAKQLEYLAEAQMAGNVPARGYPLF